MRPAFHPAQQSHLHALPAGNPSVQIGLLHTVPKEQQKQPAPQHPTMLENTHALSKFVPKLICLGQDPGLNLPHTTLACRLLHSYYSLRSILRERCSL